MEEGSFELPADEASLLVEEVSFLAEAAVLMASPRVLWMRVAGVEEVSLPVEEVFFLVGGAALMGSSRVMLMCFAGLTSSGSTEALRFLLAVWLTSASGPSGAESSCLEDEASPLGDTLSLDEGFVAMSVRESVLGSRFLIGRSSCRRRRWFATDSSDPNSGMRRRGALEAVMLPACTRSAAHAAPRATCTALEKAVSEDSG